MKSFDKLLELLNLANVPPKEFTGKNLRLGSPTVSEGASTNTKVMVEGIPGFGYYNEKEISYTRIPLTEYLTNTTVRSIVPLTKEAFMIQLNAVYDLELSLEDLEEFVIPEITLNDSVAIDLTAAASSIGFQGFAQVTYTYGRPLIESVIIVRDLTVLKFVIPNSSYLSALHMTWGKDFTSVRDAIKVKNSTYTDWDALQVACQFLNIPVWGKGNIIDIPTSADPLANTAFDRVVIQRSVVSAGMLGDLYFHYNLFDEV